MQSSTHRLGAGASLAALLALCTCAVGPDFTRPEAPLSPSWYAADAGQIDTHAEIDALWWKSFEDQTLNRLVDSAVQQNLELQIAGLRIVEARAQLGVATGRIFPQTQQLYASGQAVGLSADAPNIPGFTRHFFDFQTGFDAVWELDFWGKFRRGMEAESAQVWASMASYQSTIVTLTAEVARTYVTIRTFEALIELARQNATLQEQGLAIAETRFKNGATSELDVAQATTLLETTRASIPKLQLGLEQARNALSTLLGQPVGNVEALLEAGPAQIPRAPAKVAIGVPAELLRRRPDIRAAELEAAAQCARIGVAKADLFPSFSLGGTIGYRVASGTRLTGNPLMDIFYSVGPSLNWPFLNYGRLTNSVRVQDARFQQLLVTYQSTVLRAAQEVQDALTGLVRSQEAAAAEQRSVVAAQRSAQIALIEYREGATNYQRVIDAERSLLEQQNSLAQTTSSVTTSLIALYKALGGGWEVREGSEVVPVPMQEQMHQRTSWGGLLSPPAPETRPSPAKP